MWLLFCLFPLFGLSVSDSPSVVLRGIKPELSFSHALVSEEECGYWHFKAQGITSSCQNKGCCQGGGGGDQYHNLFYHKRCNTCPATVMLLLGGCCCIIQELMQLWRLLWSAALVVLNLISVALCRSVSWLSTVASTSCVTETVFESPPQHWHLSCYCLFMSRCCILCVFCGLLLRWICNMSLIATGSKIL